MQWFSHLTESMANLSVKMVLIAIGCLLIALTGLRLASRSRDPTAAWLLENVQVILSVIVVVFLIIRPYLFQAFYIPSSSMEPTLMGPTGNSTSGDRLLVDKLIFRIANPQRKDIVVFHAPPQASIPDEEHPEGKEFIKRTIGLPGETVEVVPPELLVDGQVGLTLTQDGTSSGIASIEKLKRPREITGPRVQIATGSGPIKVLTEPDPKVVATGREVDVDGHPELRADGGGFAMGPQIREDRDLMAYGGNVAGWVFTINDQPRLIVLRGTRMKLDPGHVLINGRRLDEPYLVDPPRYAMPPKHLERNQYFMMGDNRNNSNDSHAWGALDRWRLIGRAEILFWPISRFKIFNWWLIGVMAAGFIAYNIILKSLGAR